MITKQFRLTIALLALAAMVSLQVSAGQFGKAEPVKIRGLVGATYLKCGGVTSNGHLQITNSTSSTIPKGTTIHVFLNANLSFSFGLPYELRPGRHVYPKTGPVSPDNPQAWYFK